MVDDTITFLAVCRHGSFLAAGRELGMAGSTVSRRLDRLEKRLGTLLFTRSTRGLELTEAGLLLQDRAAYGHRALLDAEDAVRTLVHAPTGLLRIALPPGLIRDGFADLAIAFRREFPDISLEVVGTDEDVVPDGVNVHIAVRVSRSQPPEHVRSRRLGTIPMTVCASPAWIASHEPLLEPRDLLRHPCVVLGSTPSAAFIRMTCEGEVCSLMVPVALFTTQTTMARRAAVAGLGPVGLPTAACRDLLASGALVPVLAGWTLEPVVVRVLWSGDRRPALKVRSLLDRLHSAFAISHDSSA